jgi:hypothetical protein
MELDIQFKTKSTSIFFSLEKPTSIWKYTVHRAHDWNFDYVLVERVEREISFLFFNITVVTSYTTDKKWTDQYVTGLEKLANGLAKNEERILNYVDQNENILSDPSKRLKIISRGKVFTDKEQVTEVPPVAIISDFLQKEQATKITPTPTTSSLSKTNVYRPGDSKKKKTKSSKKK